MVEISKADQEVMEIVKRTYIQQFGEVEGLKQYAEYETQVAENYIAMNQPKAAQAKEEVVCHSCNGKITSKAIEYCKDNGLKPTCYKCQEKRNINRYVSGKQQDTQEPSAH